MERSLSPCKFQDLAEPEPLETDVAPVSNVVTRAARLSTICSKEVIFASYEVTVWESVWTLPSNLEILCMSSGNFATCMNISLIFLSIVLARYPVLSRSGREPFGTTVFEEVTVVRDWHVCSIAPTCLVQGWEITKLGCRHLDKSKTEKLVTQKYHTDARTRDGSSQNGNGKSVVFGVMLAVIGRGVITAFEQGEPPHRTLEVASAAPTVLVPFASPCLNGARGASSTCRSGGRRTQCSEARRGQQQEPQRRWQRRR